MALERSHVPKRTVLEKVSQLWLCVTEASDPTMLQRCFYHSRKSNYWWLIRLVEYVMFHCPRFADERGRLNDALKVDIWIPKSR